MTDVLLVAVGLLVAIISHEAGHATAAAALRLPWRPVLTRSGPGVQFGAASIRLRPWQVRVTAAAGPAANLLVAYAVAWAGIAQIVVACLLLALINLVPLPRSDGSRILRPRHAIEQALEESDLPPEALRPNRPVRERAIEEKRAA